MVQVPDVEKFMADYNMQCPMAAKRLIYSGMPATVEHGKPK
jgi:ESCRT-I complex subunit VPS28